MNTDSKLVLFTDDTSALITASNLNDLQIKSTTMLNQMNEWFKANGLPLNTEKTNVIHFKSHHLQDQPFQIYYQGKEIKEVKNTKFLGLSLDQQMEWKIHINFMISKMSSPCYIIIRSMYLLVI
jgi:hypothetical protein